MKKIIKLIKDLKVDYIKSTTDDKKLKIICYKQIIKNMFSYLWSIVSAPLMYPIWYVFKKYITNNSNKNKFIYWLWTYGDINDPLGWGGMPKDYRNGKNNFINRFWFSAIRNPRFTINHLKYKSEPIDSEIIIIDTRNYNNMIKSYGVGDMPEGVIFKWMYSKNKAYFIYENNTNESAFWFGYVGLLNDSIGKVGRFEIAYRMA